MHLSAACSHVVDIFNILRKGHVDFIEGFVLGKSVVLGGSKLEASGCSDRLHKMHAHGVQGLGGPIQLYPRRLLIFSRVKDRIGSQHDIQCSEPAALATASSSQRIAHEDT